MSKEGTVLKICKWNKAFKGIFTILAFILLFDLLQELLMPKYMGNIREGAMIAEYYHQNHDFDVIFIGDCEVYENFSTQKLWEEYGINSYIRGSAQQLVWQSYYLAEETLRYEKPDVMVFNVLAMMYAEPQSEPYNRMTLDGMKWSPSKIGSVRASMMEEEHFIEYLFPILRFHSRWNELEQDDFTYLFRKDEVTCNGYYAHYGVKPADTFPTPRKLGDYSFGSKPYEYLFKLTELCKENGVTLILVKAPSLYPYWYEEWEEQIEKFARNNHLDYYNFSEYTDEIGIDYHTDTYDGGLHLNDSGAEKLSEYFGGILAERYGLTNRKDEPKLAKSWAEKENNSEEKNQSF